MGRPLPGVEVRVSPLSAEGRADRAAAFLREVVEKMGMRCEVHLEEPGEGDQPSDIFLQIEGPDAGRLIGKKGHTLGALQYLVYRVVNRPGVPRRHGWPRSCGSTTTGSAATSPAATTNRFNQNSEIF